MDGTCPLDQALDVLEGLLDEQAQAIHAGDADALPALSTRLAAGMAFLRAGITRLPAEAQRARLRALHSRARTNTDMINRRQIDVQRSLDALVQGDGMLQDAQSNRTYAAAGRMAAPAVRGRAFAQA